MSKHSFPAGVKVLTPTGSKNIQNIQVGDKVISRAVETEVTNLVKNKVDVVYQIKFANKKFLRCAEEQSFYVNGQWVEAKNLKVGDEIMPKMEVVDLSTVRKDGNDRYKEYDRLRTSKSATTIIAIKRLPLKNPVRVYNFECATGDNYYVLTGDDWLLSHDAKEIE